MVRIYRRAAARKAGCVALAVAMAMSMLLGMMPVAASAGTAPPNTQVQLNGAYFWLQLDPIGRQDVLTADTALVAATDTQVYDALYGNGRDVVPLPSYFVGDYSSPYDAGLAVARFFHDIALTGFAGSQEAAISEFLNIDGSTSDNTTLANLLQPTHYSPNLDYLGDYYQYLLDVQSSGVPYTPGSVGAVFNGGPDTEQWLENGMRQVGGHGGTGVNDQTLFQDLSTIWTVPQMAQAQVDEDRALDTPADPVGYNAEVAMAKAYVRARSSYTSVPHQVGQEDVFSLVEGSSTTAGQIEVNGNVVSGLSYATDSANVTVTPSGSLTVTGVMAGPQAVQVTAYLNNDAKNDWIYKGLVIVTPSGVTMANFSSGTSDEEVIGTASAPATATNKVSAVGSGSSQVTVADYDQNPGGAITAYNTSGDYFDVTIVPDGSYGTAPGTLLGTTFSKVTVSVPVSSANATVYWWNGSTWAAASSQTYQTGVITVTVNSTSSPALDDLTGTPFTWVTPKGGPGPGPNPPPPVPPVANLTANGSLPPGAMVWPYQLIKNSEESFDFNKGINYQFTATKGTAPYTWTVGTGPALPGTFTWAIVPGTLPPGLTLSSSGLLSGTPKTLQSIGYFLLPVTVTDSTGATYSMNVKLFVAAYPDVIDDWAVNDIDQLATHQVTYGYPDHMFWPKKDITRGEWAQMLVLSQGLKPLSDYSDLKQFADYASIADWQKPYLAAAVKAGLMFGYGQSVPNVYVMAADKYISREEMAATIGRTYHGVTPTDLDGYFKDGYMIHDWMHNFRNDVGITLHEAIIKGYPDNTFRPYNDTLRDETAAIVARWMGIADPNE